MRLVSVPYDGLQFNTDAPPAAYERLSDHCPMVIDLPAIDLDY